MPYRYLNLVTKPQVLHLSEATSRTVAIGAGMQVYLLLYLLLYSLLYLLLYFGAGMQVYLLLYLLLKLLLYEAFSY